MGELTRAEQVIAGRMQYMQKRIAETVSGHERWGAIELVRALDHIAFAFTMAPNRAQLLANDHARRYMLLGAASALRPLLEHLDGTGGPVRWQPTNAEASDWADRALHSCGVLAALSRLAGLEHYGLAQTSFPTPDRLVIEMASDNAESTDRSALAWLRGSMRSELAEKHRALGSLALDFRNRIDRYTGIDMGGFIRYDSDPDLLNYYREIAVTRVAGNIESSSLPDPSLIDGWEFSKWRNSCVTACGRVLKHIACATRLRALHPELELRNLLTVFARKEDIAGVWGGEGHSDERITAVTAALTLDARKVVGWQEDHEVPLPYYIDIGKDFVLLPVFGALLNPVSGMTRELRHRYHRDWDAVVDGREIVFRQDLQKLFPEPRYSIPGKGVVLRRPDGAILTDVDATVLDRQTGSLALVQLKWHDVFGRSLRERNSRRLNLLQAHKWVDRVHQWIGGRTSAEVAASLHLGPAAADRGPLLLVIARNASRFTANDAYDPRAAWGGWADLVKCADADSPDALDAFSHDFRGGSAPAQEGVKGSETYVWPGFTVEVRVQQAPLGKRQLVDW